MTDKRPPRLKSWKAFQIWRRDRRKLERETLNIAVSQPSFPFETFVSYLNEISRLMNPPTSTKSIHQTRMTRWRKDRRPAATQWKPPPADDAE